MVLCKIFCHFYSIIAVHPIFRMNRSLFKKSFWFTDKRRRFKKFGGRSVILSKKISAIPRLMFYINAASTSYFPNE